MKVFELLRDDIPVPTEAELCAALAKMNWSYEFDDSEYVRRSGQKMMEKIENMVYQSYKVNPNKTMEIWNKYCPWSERLDEVVVPDFIFRFGAMEDER